MSTRSLLIEEGNRLILIDTGMGNKQGDRFFEHYGLWGNFSLEKSLKEHGFHPDEITDVFFTHLHFDHCGGAIQKSASGLLQPAFKNAQFWVHKEHWKWACVIILREPLTAGIIIGLPLVLIGSYLASRKSQEKAVS